MKPIKRPYRRMHAGAVRIARSALVAIVLVTTGLVLLPPTPAAATFPGREGRIAFDDFITGEIYAVDPDGTGLVRLTHEPRGVVAVWPSWSPDGSHLVFTRFNFVHNVGRIWMMRADGSHQHRVASEVRGINDFQPTYTPDGEHIVFIRVEPGGDSSAIWIMRANGTHMRPIVRAKTGAHAVFLIYQSVSSNGHHLAYTAFGQRGIAAQIHTVRLNGTHNRTVTPPRLEAAGPSWAPNEDDIVFYNNAHRLNNNVHTMEADGSEITKLTTTKWPNSSFGVSYSPTGDHVAFSSDRRYSDLCCVDLFVMNEDGSHQHRVRIPLRGVVDVAWGSAHFLPPGSSTLATGGRLGAPRSFKPQGIALHRRTRSIDRAFER